MKTGIYRFFVRCKAGSNGEWLPTNEILSYVKVSEHKILRSGQYNMISNDTPDPTSISTVMNVFPLDKIPVTFKNFILCGISSGVWNYYDNCRTGIINLVGDNLNQNISLPNGYTSPTPIINSSNRVYVEVSLDKDFSEIFTSYNYYNAGGEGNILFQLKNADTSPSSQLSLLMTYFEYDETAGKLYPVKMNYQYTHRGALSPYNFVFATTTSVGAPDDWVELLENAKPYEPTTDPYVNGGGASGGGGGTGDFDNTSDVIGLPSLPSLSGLNTGFFTAFIPSASQMQSVSNYLWNNFLEDIIDPNQSIGEKVDALKKIVANPYDAIMGCSVIPVTPPTAGSKEMKMYGLIETGISMPYASTRWVTVDCGTLNIHEFWGGYLDYSPYTKTTSLYLPYVGTVSIDIDLIMAKALQVVYRVDILSGICVAFILVDGSVKFHYQGQCATQIPITNADYSSVISTGIGLIGSASQVVGSAVAGASTGGPVGAVVGAVGSAVSQAPSVASNVMGAKPDIRSGGSVGSSAGILSVQKPYLIIERPRQSAPEFQNTLTGYPANITANVGDLVGYTEFETINLDNLFLTDAEKEELTSILKGGVYL